MLMSPVLAFNAYSQNVRPEIQSIVKEIADYNVLDGPIVGYSGSKSKQWDRFKKLYSQSGIDELRTLTSHDNAVVRCYAFKALMFMDFQSLFPIVLKHLNDTVYVHTLDNCVGVTTMVGDYFLDHFPANPVQKNTIDSILFNDKNIKLWAKYKFIQDLKPEQQYYIQLRKIAIEDNYPIAIVAIAKYNIKTDINLISTLFDRKETEVYGIDAAKKFPDSSFYHYLVNIFKNDWSKKYYDYPKWRNLYQALAKYPSQQTLNLFDKTIKTKNDFRHQVLGKYLLIALTKYPNPLFDRLLSRITLRYEYKNDIEDEINIEQ